MLKWHARNIYTLSSQKRDTLQSLPFIRIKKIQGEIYKNIFRCDTWNRLTCILLNAGLARQTF